MQFDLLTEQYLYSLRTPAGVTVWSIITSFGGMTAIAILCVLALWALRHSHRWHFAAGLLASVVGGIGFGYLLKHTIQRARPPLFMHAVVENDFSFPSMHAIAAMTMYGFLIFLAYRLFPRRSAILVSILLALLIGAIGFSRLYLGVHYPTDIIAGYIIGGLFLWIGIKCTNGLKLFRRFVSHVRRD